LFISLWIDGGGDMDYRTGKMKKVKKKVKMIPKDLREGIKERVDSLSFVIGFLL
jgi:hypothetical protein